MQSAQNSLVEGRGVTESPFGSNPVIKETNSYTNVMYGISDLGPKRSKYEL
jgi:hypothetical protein